MAHDPPPVCAAAHRPPTAGVGVAGSIALAALGVLGCWPESPGPGDGRRPNIIVIFADDYGKDAAHLYHDRTGAPAFPATAPTPSLRALADRGVLFLNGWAMPACSPTRGTRATGRLPSSSGMGWVVGPETPRVGAPGSRFEGVVFPPTILDPHDPDLLQRRAKDAGYRTYKLGKWHETAGSPGEILQDVLDSGFDVFYGQAGGFPNLGYGGSAAPFDFWIPVTNLDGPPLVSEFLPSALVSRAIQLIAEAGDEPYLLDLDFASPHWDYEVAPGPGEPAPADNPHDWHTLDGTVHADLIAQVEAAYGGSYPPAGTPALTPTQASAAFKTLVAYMDVQIGRLLEHVDLEDTYVFFAGDNGTEGGGANILRDVVEAPYDPLQSKGTLYRNGVEVPFLVAGPVRGPGRISDALVTTTDIHATVLELIGEGRPGATRGDSVSFARVLRGARRSRWFNVAELFSPTATVGGSAEGPLVGPGRTEGRVVATERFRLLARPVSEDGAYVCREGVDVDPADDCLDPESGLYEKEIFLEFYDVQSDPFEKDALIPPEMSWEQLLGFVTLCTALNHVSERATYFQNGRDCALHGGSLIDLDP